MASRKPLILLSGVSAELPPGDTVVGASNGTLTAGSGLVGGGDLSTNQRIDVSLAAAPSGLIFVGNQLGLDGAAQASGNAAQVTANTALASGNAALSRAGGTMTGPIIFANGQQINTAVNLSGGISGAIAYQSAPNTSAFLSPGVSGQVLATQGSNQNPTWITPGGGKILQAVQSVYTSSNTTTSSSFTQTGLTVTITPSSASSRILVTASFFVYVNGSHYAYFTFNLNSGSVPNLASTNTGFASVGGVAGQFSTCLTYIHSPSTTSATTYTVSYRSSSTGSQTTFNDDSGFSGVDGNAIITALEIGP